jgi:1,4-alpha-glucan branching enzyme
LYKNQPALWELDDTYEGFEWIDFHDADNCVLAFLRRPRQGDPLIFVLNATPVVRKGYRVGVPDAGWYREVLNSDSEFYGGGNVGNGGGVEAKEEEWQGRSHSVWLTLPPLSVVIVQRV